MVWTTNLTLLGYDIILGGSFLLMVCYVIRFYLRAASQFEKEYSGLSDSEYHWLIWPAIGVNLFLEKLFGKRGGSIKDLFTIRSVGVTFLIGFVSLLICVIFLIIWMPPNFPHLDAALKKMLILSCLVFICFNFLGDLISISFTRYVLALIVNGKCNFLRYIKIDLTGILLGYLVTLLPSLSTVLFCLMTGDNLNKWINNGLLGNVIVPFCLFIFGTTNLPFVFSFFAFIAVFTVTIPTVIYITLIIFCYLGYRLYSSRIKEDKKLSMSLIVTCFISVLTLLLSLGGILIAIDFLMNHG